MYIYVYMYISHTEAIVFSIPRLALQEAKVAGYIRRPRYYIFFERRINPAPVVVKRLTASLPTYDIGCGTMIASTLKG